MSKQQKEKNAILERGNGDEESNWRASKTNRERILALVVQSAR